MAKYYVKETKVYGCVVYQVINGVTNAVSYYDKDFSNAQNFCNRQNNCHK